MVQTRGSSGDQGSGQTDQITTQLAAIAAKLDAIDTMKDDIAALKARDRTRANRFEDGESSSRSQPHFRPYNKIEFPPFSGGDPRGWLLKAEKYFRYYQIPEEDKIEVASMHLEEEALDLYSWLAADQPLLLWEDLVQAFNKSFGPAEFVNPDEFLCSVKQTGTVQTYRQEFAKRSARVTNWPDHCLLGVFLNGLKEELRTDVRIHKPRTVYNAMSLAVEFEAKANQIKGGRGTTGGQMQGRNNTSDTELVTPLVTTTANQHQTPLRISDAEKQSRFNRGECFRCGEKFRPGHRCKTSSLQLLEAEERNVIEAMEGEERDERVAEISLQAIMGVPHHATLMVPGLINSSKVSVLIDCGSTHNFVNDTLISKIGLSTHDVVSFGVRIGNGDIIRCSRVCKAVEMYLADLQLIQDLYPFSLGGADVVLGIQWLATLNTVRANWKLMFLKFNVNGKDYTLQGEPPDFKQSATLRQFTIEPIEVDSAGPSFQIATRLEDKSSLGVGCIDTDLIPLERESSDQGTEGGNR